MNDFMINRETKLTLLDVIRTGQYTKKQREIIANAFNLFHEQSQMIIRVMDEDAKRSVEKFAGI